MKFILFFIQLFLLCLLNATYYQSVYATESNSESFEVEIPIIKEMRSSIDLLEYPGYLLLIIENNGIRLANSIEISSDREIKAGGSLLRFLKREGSRFFYQARIESGLLGEGLSHSLQVEVDISKLQQGSIILYFRSPFIKLLSTQASHQIKTKIKTITNENAQKIMIDFLQAIPDYKNKGIHDPQVREIILLKAYNSLFSQIDESGDLPPRNLGFGIPVALRISLLLLLFILLIMTPLVTLGRKLEK